MEKTRLDIKSNNVSNHAELEEIINGCKKNDRISQQKLYAMFYSKMMITCLKYNNNREEAKDILQDGFMKIFMNINKYTSEGSFEGWARRVFVNLSIDNYRKKKKDNVTVSSDLIENTDVGIFEEETNGSKYNFRPEEVMGHIQSLSPAYRTVFNLYVIEGYTHKEIAQILDIGEGTSKSNLAKAKSNLKMKLMKNSQSNG